MPAAADERRRQLLAAAHALSALAQHRSIVPIMTAHVKEDLEIRRLLDSVVRRWSKLVAVEFTTADARANPTTEVAVDHIVPCRVLVDRMLMKPEESPEVLEHGVALARITRAEHLRLGGIFTHHEKLYGLMLTCPPKHLVDLGRDRYAASHIRLVKA